MSCQNFLPVPAPLSVPVPVLTVMVDYGNAPFLWLPEDPEDGGIGTLVYDGMHWDESLPLSHGLWRKFAD